VYNEMLALRSDCHKGEAPGRVPVRILWLDFDTDDVSSEFTVPNDHSKALSKIFEALKRAELARVDSKDSPASGTETSRQPERRRTSRIPVQVPLFVYGHTGDNPFHEEACTVEINAHGGLISMQTAVRPGQKLLLMNKEDESSQQCIVLSVRVRQERAFDVSFEFPTAIPQFWQNSEIGRSFLRSAALSTLLPSL